MGTHRNDFSVRVWGGAGHQRLAPLSSCRVTDPSLLHVTNDMDPLSQGNSELNLNLLPTTYQSISAFYIEMSCWPWALRVSWACNTLPSAHKAIHRKLGSRRACKNHLQAGMGGPPSKHPVTGQRQMQIQSWFLFHKWSPSGANSSL